MVENDGEFPETDVKVALNSDGGEVNSWKASPRDRHDGTKQKDRERRNPRLTGFRPTWPRRSKCQIEPVPGETNHEGTKGTFLGIFE